MKIYVKICEITGSITISSKDKYKHDKTLDMPKQSKQHNTAHKVMQEDKQ